MEFSRQYQMYRKRSAGICDHMPEKFYIKGRLPAERSAATMGQECAVLRKNPGVSCKDAGRSRSADHKRNGNRIDSEGKRALAGGMPTWAVLGSGPDVCYPATQPESL